MKKLVFLAGLMIASTSVFADQPTKYCHYTYGSLTWNCNASVDNSAPGQFNSGVVCEHKSTCDVLPTPTSPTTYSCADGDCGLSGAASFDFNIEMGGAAANLFVCEVGFLKHLCDTKDCGSRYLQIGSQQIKGTDTQKYLTFTQANAPSSADLFLNDLNFGASFYVKYCLDIKRRLVGAPANYPTFNFDASVTLTPGNKGVGTADDYFDVSELKAQVYKSCSSNGTYPTTAGIIDGEATGLVDSYDHFEDLTSVTSILAATENLTSLVNSYGLIKKNCVYTVVYREMNKCIRPLRDLGEKTFAGKINTTLKFDLFDCAAGNCNVVR